jgi:1-acyl-sn-glycerol-3-phosphate acyltransferase
VIFRTVFLVLFYAVAVVALVPILFGCLLFGARGPLFAVSRWAMRVSRRILGLEIEIRGRAFEDPNGPAVFMANHLSFIDGPMMFMLIPRPVRIILKKSVFGIPVIGQAMRFAGFIPVDRKGVSTGRAAVARAVRVIQRRRFSFLIFPEGTRSRDGRLQVFRKGGFYLAVESGAPIVPVSIWGTFSLMPKGRIVPRRGPIRVTFHPPVEAAGTGPDRLGDLIERVRTTILSGLEEGVPHER